jgi:hypothetical protein
MATRTSRNQRSNQCQLRNSQLGEEESNNHFDDRIAHIGVAAKKNNQSIDQLLIDSPLHPD